MTVFNRYLISLVLAACFANVILAYLKQDNLEIYFVLNLIAYLTITLLYVLLNRRAKSALGSVTSIFFGSFMVIVVIKIIEMVSKGQ